MIDIKLLTLNTHSLVEENYSEKLMDFATAISNELPDIIALQEVNQTCEEEIVPMDKLVGLCSCNGDIPIRKDNHIYRVMNILREKDIHYDWTWIGMKKGYGKYDEGIGILSRSKIIETDVVLISDLDDYNNWKTRKIIGIRTKEEPDTWFYSVHMGWWNDEEEPFQRQWARTDAYMKKHEKVWLMGDFNSPAEVLDEGYDMIRRSGWHDSYTLAVEKDNGITVGRSIDGWKDKPADTSGMRIDQIWCNRQVTVDSSKVIFNGNEEPIVSDHYGIIIEL